MRCRSSWLAGDRSLPSHRFGSAAANRDAPNGAKITTVPQTAASALLASLLIAGCYQGVAADADSAQDGPASFGPVTMGSSTIDPATTENTASNSGSETDANTDDTASTDPSVGTSVDASGSDATDPVTSDPVTSDPVTSDPVTSASESLSASASSGGPDPVCGDANLDPGEQCDDGDDDNNDACLDTCEVATCGDGFLYAALEECDDGNNDPEVCAADCSIPFKLVFASSELYVGNLGGLAGADANCQTLADSAGLAGSYLAWLSTDAASPSTRFNHSTLPYRLVDGTTVAVDWDDLVDGTLNAAIAVTELGGAVPPGDTGCGGADFPTAWSATTSSGGFSGSGNCLDWTSIDDSGAWGLATATDGSWSDWCTGGTCSWLSPLYCFGQ